MEMNVNKLIGFSIKATDGEFGNVHDFYFDDRIWIVRYFVANTTPWLPERLVLVSPAAIENIDWEKHSISINLNREQVVNSPAISQDMPVSRYKELELIQYYGWPDYWQPMEVNLPESAVLITKWMAQKKVHHEGEEESPGNPWLRSTKEIRGYKIKPKRGYAGRIVDYLIENENWIIRHFVVKTNIWGRKALLAPAWIENIDWAQRQFHVNIAPKLIKNAERYKKG
jgi:hypothetical protein